MRMLEPHHFFRVQTLEIMNTQGTGANRRPIRNQIAAKVGVSLRRERDLPDWLKRLWNVNIKQASRARGVCCLSFGKDWASLP